MAQHFHHPSDIPNLKPSHSLCEIDPSMDILMSQFPDFNPGAVDSSNLNMQNLMGFSQDSYFTLLQQDQFPGNLAENFPAIFPSEFKTVLSISKPNWSSASDHVPHEDKKRKSMHTPESSSANSSPPVSENGIRRRNSTGRGKRARSNDKEEEKSKQVVHVRAKRGQATDSHSLAERVRRGKINERLRCLQNIVPGCHKTMGMALMLDEIINYVQSLQNQVEFLSMKLTAASNLYSFNGEADTIDTIQREKAFEAVKMHKLMKEEWHGLASTQLGQFDMAFGCDPALPYNR